jgi:hypothetical protein
MTTTFFAKLAAAAVASVMMAACAGSGGDAASGPDAGASQVDKPAGGATATKSSAPVIEGSPPTAVTVSSTYDFRPSATDADGDALRFSVANKPAWTAFDPATGRLSGNPHGGGRRNLRQHPDHGFRR